MRRGIIKKAKEYQLSLGDGLAEISRLNSGLSKRPPPNDVTRDDGFSRCPACNNMFTNESGCTRCGTCGYRSCSDS